MFIYYSIQDTNVFGLSVIPPSPSVLVDVKDADVDVKDVDVDVSRCFGVYIFSTVAAGVSDVGYSSTTHKKRGLVHKALSCEKIFVMLGMKL